MMINLFVVGFAITGNPVYFLLNYGTREIHL